MVDEQFDFYIKAFQRDINCLIHTDRQSRKEALEKIYSEAKRAEELQDSTDFSKLLKDLISPLLKCLEDKIEKHREITLNILDKLIGNHINIKDEYNFLIPSILNRVNNIPFPETSEELRQKIIDILMKILKFSHYSFKSFIPDLCSVIAKLLTDPCPEVKNKLCDFIKNLSEQIGKEIGPHSKQIVLSLCKNLSHNHNKVRKNTIISLGYILMNEGSGKFFEDCLIFFKKMTNDKNIDVRKSFYQVTYNIILNFNVVLLNKFEHHLVIFLLNGISDENSDVSCISKEFLEKAGIYRQKLENAVKEGENQMKID